MHRIYLLMYSAYGRGGVARTVINLANHLADAHQVELVSLYRHRKPVYAIDPRVRVTFLKDVHSDRLHALHARRTRLRPVPVETDMSLLTDLLLWWKLKRLRTGILISTRPSLHLAAARWAPRRMTTIGQDHLNFPVRFRNAAQARVLRTAIPRLDAYTVLTTADAEDYRVEMPEVSTEIAVIRNALPWPVEAPTSEPARRDNKVVVAAGRLTKEKGFRRLISAWEPIARTHPDWQLHIYGGGAEHTALAMLIDEAGLSEHVVLKGYTSEFRAVLSESSIYAMSSFSEGFPMVLIEAMSTGLPLVSFDCPRGPGEIIEDGRNGRLVPDGDVAGFTEALDDLISDGELRRRLGDQALEDAKKYEIDTIVAEWEALFATVAR